jgi:hypothetical protein
MTAQIGDDLIWKRNTYSLLGAPDLARHPRIVEVKDWLQSNHKRRDRGIGSSGCWRGYIASWKISRNRLFLCGIEGNLALKGREPLFAGWMKDWLRIATGDLVNYMHSDFSSTYDGVVEFEVIKGLVTRHRMFAVPACETSEPWRTDPASRHLFANTADAACVEPPERRELKEEAFRRMCAERRGQLGFRPGEVAARLGFQSHFGARLTEWERGERVLHEGAVLALMKLLEISAGERAVLKKQESSAARRELKQWRDAPFRPVLVQEGNHYAIPYGLEVSRDAAVAWAEACVQAAWRPAALWLSRREVLWFDENARLTRKPARRESEW